MAPDSDNPSGERDARKTLAAAQQNIRKSKSTVIINGFDPTRELLRGNKVKQSGAGASLLDTSKVDETGIFYLDGEEHRRKRAVISKYFTLKAIETRYQAIIERVTDKLLAEFRKAGRGRLNDIGFHLAVAVVAEILGLSFENDLVGLADRVVATTGASDQRLPVRDGEDAAVHAFFETDVLPAINARRNNRREDVISRLLDDGWSDRAILTEALAYSVAGMLTTREFIVMATWYLCERPELRAQFRTGDRDVQFGILEEILRLEPIVGVIVRRTTEDVDLPACGHIASGTLLAMDVRYANMDESYVGACPHAIDPARAKTSKAGSGFMSFGDGPHRCPGAQLALHEARLFLDRLFQIPGLKLERAPDITWYRPISGYELYDAIITCDPA
jgi:cytochrome P450